MSDDALPVDPVRERRAQWARWGEAGTRVGYGLILVAVVAFVVGFLTDFPAATTTVVVVCLVGTVMTLAPGIVIGYAVKAAEREDREQGR
ncbi:MAG: hypothetical protein ACRD0S_02260 [Acidimicrobiales bacterium]